MLDLDSILPGSGDHQALLTLLEGMGVAGSYIDFSGQQVAIDLANRASVLELMGIAIDSVADIHRALDDYQNRLLEHPLPRVPVLTEHQQNTVELCIRAPQLDDRINWRITTETGQLLQGSVQPKQLPELSRTTRKNQVLSMREWRLPGLPAGYHVLHLDVAGNTIATPVIVAPQQCFQPPWEQQGRKLAGVSVQLYSLRSERNWGMGDLSDLRQLIRELAAQHIDFIVLNPLHALDALAPENCSPYSPLDRRFLNPLYLDVEQEVDFQQCQTARQFGAPEFRQQLAQLRDRELVDYAAVCACKYAAFSLMFEHFKEQHLCGQTDRADSFSSWCALKGTALQTFAEFEASRFRTQSAHGHDPEFHLYLQWLTEQQLAACQQLAIDSGMALGLVRDLAVGGTASSAEVQLNPGLFSSGASIGAPVDQFAPQGQNWGLPPIDPNALQDTGFRHFIELLNNNMLFCGALRIDHVMALMRLWWCPGSDHTGKGAYVFYPVEALFAIMRLESQRHSCLVIGEDLGVVPPEIRQYMAESAVFSNVLFYFEKYDPVHFKKPEHYPVRSLAMVSNHDVPTLQAWWDKSDLELRREIGLITASEQMQSAVHARESDLIQVLHWLDEQGLLPDQWRDFNIHKPLDVSLIRALLQANGRSAARLVSLQLEDLCFVQKPVNIPGTSSEYPNWRRKLPLEVGELLARPESISLLDAFTTARS